MSVEKKVPEIRFKGFSGEWVKEILSELVKLENGFAFQSKYFKKTPTKVIVLTPGNVNIGGGFQAGKGQYYDEKQEVSSKYIFKPGDMFITMTDLTPTAQALGFPAIIPKDENTYLHNQRLGKLVGFNGDLAFFYSLLCTMKKQKEVVSTSSGTTVKHTSPDKFLNRTCLFPNKEEQTKIGNYFQKLDVLLDQYQQKHNKLNNIKKAMLEKMFPKQGETIPEIRFKGFSGEWEETILSEAADKYDNLRVAVTAKDRIAGNTPYYGANGIQGYVEGHTHNGEYVLLAEDGANDLKSYPIHYVNGKIWVNNHAHVLKAKENISNIFLKYALNNIDFEPFLVGGGRAKLNASIMMNLVLTISTDIKEQAKIGNFFQKLDTLIDQHQQQITKLNNIKQACLRKMFV